MTKFKNFNKFKLIISSLLITGSLLISLMFYNNQNFQEYTKISITYNNVSFESHRNFIKLFRNLEHYKFWLKNENPTAEIFDYVNEGSFSNVKGYTSNSNLVFPTIRRTESTYYVVIKKTSNENLKSIKEYLEFTATKIQDQYKNNFTFYNIAISYPSGHYRVNFKPLTFYIFGSFVLSLFSLAILFYLYEELKSLKLLK